MILEFINSSFFKKSILKILIFILFSAIVFNKQIESKDRNKGNVNLKNIINKLNSFSDMRKPEYIIFSDYFTSKYCSDINAYTIFDYYLNQDYYNAYYIINIESELYYSLNEQNKTKNLILINNTENIYNDLHKPWNNIFQDKFHIFRITLCKRRQKKYNYKFTL